MVDQWMPGVTRKMLRGTPAIVWGRRVLVTALAIPGLSAVLLLGMLFTGDGYGSSSFLISVMALLCVDALILFASQILSSWKGRAEKNSGYTTFRDEMDFDEVDHKSGQIVRMAGEPFLSSQERLARIDKIRAITVTDGGAQ